jgi:bacterioferritin (cytochrome b1)
MSITVRDYVNILKRKFNFVETRRTSHTFYELVLEGLPPVRTMASHNRKRDIGKPLERDLARELRVPTAFFRGMFSCARSYQDYSNWLRCLYAKGKPGA